MHSVLGVVVVGMARKPAQRFCNSLRTRVISAIISSALMAYGLNFRSGKKSINHAIADVTNFTDFKITCKILAIIKF